MAAEKESPDTFSAAQRGQYIIALNLTNPCDVDRNVISAVAAELSQEPESTVLKVASPQGFPERLVVLLTPERAERIRAEYQGRLIVDADAPLEPSPL